MYKVESPEPGLVSLHVRISDNVLNEKDWPVRRVVLDRRRNRIVKHEDVKSGVYGFDGGGEAETGWSLKRLQHWSAYDSTGNHPEDYYEIQNADGEFSQFWSPDDFEKALNEIERRAGHEERPWWCSR